MRLNLSLFLTIFLAVSALGQKTPFVQYPYQLGEESYAEWIVPGGEEEKGVFYFRKNIDLGSVPDQFLVYVSADMRYRLYVNGHMVGWGPALGDLYHWNYETINLAPYLEEGENVVGAQVWNPGSKSGQRHISSQTAFILQGNSDVEQVLNTDQSWKVLRDEGHFFIGMNSTVVGGGYIAGACDSIVGAKHPWDWMHAKLDDPRWNNAVEIGKGNHSGLDTWYGTPWLLQERKIPLMEQRLEPVADILYVEGVEFPEGVDPGNISLDIPAGSRVDILLDNRVLTMGFPQLAYSGGTGSSIKIFYQEALFDSEGRKGMRDEWQGKIMKGYYDVILPDGGERVFEPLWIRVFRYVKLSIETGENALHIRGINNLFTAYPFEEKATFSSDQSFLDPIWEVSWRTARLCALETYMDCPYYEQIQYIGDTRIQALISLYVSGDDRLVKNAINQFYHSMQPMGLTQSRFPASGQQIIPPFSLYFILMVHDFHMYRDDPGFTEQFLPGIRFILDWFEGRIDESGMLGPLPYWNHIDGGADFRAGSPPGIDEGGSAHMSILLAYTMDKAAELLIESGDECNAKKYKELSARLKAQTMELCYNHEKGLIAETPLQEVYSQHTLIFGILSGMFEGQQAEEVAEKLIRDEDLIQTSLYFKFYLLKALYKVGMGEAILSQMDAWTEFLEQGLTTFPEHGLNSRSDCHAWSAHPMYDMLSMVCGIHPAEPGFKTVRIEPLMGNLTRVSGSMPHPQGTIEVSYFLRKGKLEAEIVLPNSLEGTFLWKNQSYELHPGRQLIRE